MKKVIFLFFFARLLCGASSDALTLAHRADAAVLVVDLRRAGRAATQEAAAKLGAMSRSPLLAVVLVP